MGTRMIVVSVGIILIVLAATFGDLIRAKRAAAPLAAVVVLLALLVPARNVQAYGCFSSAEPLNECLGRTVRDGWDSALNSGCLRETSYYCIKVADTTHYTGRPVRELILDHLIHSYNALDDPTFLDYGYIKVYAEVADALTTRLPDRDLQSLFIGGGGYTLPRYFEATYPNSHTTIMEIDPGVTQTVYEQLGVDRATTKLDTYNVDARLMMDQLMQTRRGAYDLIIGDAFNDLSIPYHLTTQEFDRKAKALLKDDGVFLVLVIDKLHGGRFLPAYTRTIQTVFPYVALMADADLWDTGVANTFVVAASNQPLDPERIVRARGQGLNGESVTHIMPAARMDAWLAEWDAPLLTDDYAPVDNLIAPIFADRGF
jgi:spermidine synthase